MLPEALDPSTLRTVALVALVVLAVLVFLVVRFVQKVVLRLVVVGMLVIVGIGVWVQRAELSTCRTTGSCTFFGQDVQVPDAVPR